jgi:hypothetical protein
MRTNGHWRLLLVGAPLLAVVQLAYAQDAAPAPAPETSTQTTSATPAPAPEAATPAAAPQAATPVPDPAIAAPAAAEPQAPAAAQAAEPQAATPVATPAADSQVAAPAAVAATAPSAQQTAVVTTATVKEAKGKSKKVEYTGPTTVIVQPPTPMLDEEGRQRIDPDGQLMFNPPLKQQRDKKGHPLFDVKGRPVFQTATELGYDEHGKKLHVKKEKEPKMIPVSISRGTFTVDGMIGKAELNYDIADLKYIYFYAPGIGTLVVSNRPFPGAKEQKSAFNAKTLTVSVTDHKLQLASDKLLLGKKPESAFVLVDRDFKLPTPYPVVGYGKVTKAPYVWPGGHENRALAGAFVQPPPIPVSLRPVMLLPPCPAGQMRKASPPVLPGEDEKVQPCTAILKQKVATASTATAATSATVPAATGPAISTQP